MSCSLFRNKTWPPENAVSSWPLPRAALAKTKWAAEYCVFVQESKRLLGLNLCARRYSRQWTDCWCGVARGADDSAFLCSAPDVRCFKKSERTSLFLQGTTYRVRTCVCLSASLLVVLRCLNACLLLIYSISVTSDNLFFIATLSS